MNKAIFLDRDGVIIYAPVSKDKKPKSIKNFSGVKILPHVLKVCQILRKQYLLFMITNQPEVARKNNTKKNVEKINSYLKKKLRLKDVYDCYSNSEKNKFRKPNPGMIISAAKKYNIELKKSYMIGDRWRDVDAGYNASCKTIFIDRSYSEKLRKKPNFKIKKFKDVLKYVKF